MFCVQYVLYLLQKWMNVGKTEPDVQIIKCLLALPYESERCGKFISRNLIEHEESLRY